MASLQQIILFIYLICRITVQQIQPWLPIRLQFEFLDTYSAGQVTEINTLIEISQQFYQSSILVQRSSSKLRFSDAQQPDCNGYIVPDDLMEKEYDADLVFFVTTDDTKENIIAFSGPCALHKSTFKPVFSILGFGDIASLQNNTGTVAFANIVATTIHEFMHGLGFISQLYDLYMDSNSQSIHKSTSFLKDNILYLTTPRVLQYTRQYFGCPDATGNPMEDQGPVGSKDSHWERRLFYNDILIAQNHVGDFIFSIFNYKLLEDSGWYKLGDISVDPMTFGSNKGCDFLYNGCLAGTFPEYCASSEAGQGFQCSWSQVGMGNCAIDQFSNTCQMIQINTNEDCRDPLDLQNLGQFLQSDFDTMQTFTYDSKCFNGSFTNQSNSSTLNIFSNSSCHQFKCQGLTSISIIIGQDTIQCAKDNQQLTIPNLSGMIQCPQSIQQFCLEYTECPNQCNERGFCVNKKCFCIKGYSGLGCEQNCDTYRSQGQCVTSCPEKTFSDENTRSCLGCPYNCDTCSTIGECDICKEGFILRYGSCENAYQFDALIAQEQSFGSSRFQSFSSISWIIKSLSWMQLLIIIN